MSPPLNRVGPIKLALLSYLEKLKSVSAGTKLPAHAPPLWPAGPGPDGSLPQLLIRAGPTTAAAIIAPGARLSFYFWASMGNSSVVAFTLPRQASLPGPVSRWPIKCAQVARG